MANRISTRPRAGRSAAPRARRSPRSGGRGEPAATARLQPVAADFTPSADRAAFRPALIARARARLAAGFYDMPEVLELAVGRMIRAAR